jgi:ribonuclease E
MGKQKIVISERDNIAVLFDDDSAVEFIIHRGDVLLGDVYLAQVENILPSIDAAFVNVGTERMGFLHSSDVQGKGDLKNRLQPKQNIVVQVMKEPTGHKGPRVTTNLALPGRFLVLMPESKGISISRKIAELKERSRLKSIVSITKPPGVGVIIRTEAENQSDNEITEDFETLIERWQNIVAMADTAKPPTLLYRDQDLLYRVIREMVTEDVKEILVDTQFGQQRANQLLQNWGIEHPVKVTLYSGPNSIMVGAGIDKEIKQALQTKVPLPSGGYLYIQPTEALCVIDVNSGKFTSLASQAETIRLTNLEAAKEIARQLRLRNIGGMIIVDFIDMESRADQLSILENFENELAADKAKPQIGQLSDLGLVEMTRHRQGQSLSEIFTKKCIACSGSGLTLEDFNWAPSTSDLGRGMAGRTKLPIKQQRGGQGGQGGGQQQKQSLPKAGAQTLRKFIDPRSGINQPLREGFLQQSKEAEEKQEKAATENMTIEEVFQHRIVRKIGVRFSHVVKLAHLPLQINSVMVRINPKSNDIFTLVDAIEGSAYLPSDVDMEYEESMDADMSEPGQNGQGDGDGDGFDVGEEDEEPRGKYSGRDDSPPDDGFEEEPASPREGFRQPVAVQQRSALIDMDEYETDEELDDGDSRVAIETARHSEPEESEDEEEESSEEAESVPSTAPSRIRSRRGRPPAKTRLKPAAATTAEPEAEESTAAPSDEEGPKPPPRRGRIPRKPAK